jgi:hypothetical protein
VAPPATPPPATPPPVTTSPELPRQSAPGSPTPTSVTPTRPGASDRTRGVGTKSVGGKTFHLAAGEWIDADYRRADVLPVVDITTREDLATHAPVLAFSVLGSRFTVVLDGTVYRVRLPRSDQ